jgi:hypothetical protein
VVAPLARAAMAARIPAKPAPITRTSCSSMLVYFLQFHLGESALGARLVSSYVYSQRLVLKNVPETAT